MNLFDVFYRVESEINSYTSLNLALILVLLLRVLVPSLLGHVQLRNLDLLLLLLYHGDFVFWDVTVVLIIPKRYVVELLFFRNSDSLDVVIEQHEMVFQGNALEVENDLVLLGDAEGFVHHSLQYGNRARFKRSNY